MKCEKCNEREATFFYSSNYNGKVSERHLCPECARAEGFGEMLDYSPAGMFDNAFGSMFGDFFAPMRSFLDAPAFDFFGAPMRSIMAPALPRIRFVVGEGQSAPARPLEASEAKIPADAGEDVRRERERAALKAQLEDAVKAEDFEKAIVLRDKLREMEK